jgi:hypothetical protein
MAQVTIEIQEAQRQWLVDEAKARRVSVEDLISSLIAEKQGDLPLSANERYILRLLQNVSNKPGWVVPTRILWTNWQLRGSLSELSKALEALANKGLLAANQAFTEFQLTESGFSTGRD